MPSVNRVIALALLAAAGGLTACFNLDEKVVSGVTSSYYESPQGLNDAVSAAYAGLRDFYGQERSMTAMEMGTDIWIKGADGSYKYFNDYTPQLDPRSSIVTDIWTLHYRAINTANAVIDRAEKVPISSSFTEADRTERLAEVRFLRAVYYFNLVRFFGDVPLNLHETVGVVTDQTRAPKADVYKAIIDDLNFAVQNLPLSQKDYGRATKGAAEAVLARVYLTRVDAGDLDKAAQLDKDVIASGQFALLPRYADLFDINNQKNKEIVFPVIFTSDLLTDGPGNRWHLYWLMEYDVLPGMQRTIQYGRPFKRLRPTKYLLGLWNRQIDARYFSSFQHVWFANNDRTIPKDASGKPLFSVGDTSIYLTATPAVPDAYKNKPYRVYAEKDYSYRIFPALVKHQDPTRGTLNQEEGQRDFFVLRLATVYLDLAEALVRAGKPSEAVPYVNAVRERAAYPGHQAEMDVTAADMSVDFILDERARELAGEGERWFDLVRNGKLLERVKKYNEDAAPNIQPFHVLRPVPQTQIDRTTPPGSFAQNPGY